MGPRRSRLIVFTRFPEPGTTKTRLIPALGPTAAADLQRRLTERTLGCARRLQEACSLIVEVRFQGGDRPTMERWLGADLLYRPQGEGDIGERMHRAFGDAFENGASRVVLVGSDIPGLTPEILERAFEGLHRCDLVLGPAMDGGYYLMGLRKPVPPLFSGISWGNDRVLTQTLKAAETLGLTVELVGTLSDIDRIEDLGVLQSLTE